jgi:hypothetical protein
MTMMIEAVGFPKTSVNMYQNARCNIPEGGHLRHVKFEVFHGGEDDVLLGTYRQVYTALKLRRRTLSIIFVHYRVCKSPLLYPILRQI